MRALDFLRDLTRRIFTLDRRVHALREELDAFRSSHEVPDKLIQEFHTWKNATPVPREPLVSICIATYNRAKLLAERSVASALAQDYPRVEVIVVGDGCTDETEWLMRSISDPRLTFVNLPERGRYPSDPLKRWMVAGTPPLNHAMSLARGDFITHLDDDDEHPSERTTKLVGFALEHGCDFIWHPFYYQRPNGRWALSPATEFAFEYVSTSSIFYRSWFKTVEWNIDAWRTQEPGDWNRLRRIKYIGPDSRRYPEPLLRHYRERSQRV